MDFLRKIIREISNLIIPEEERLYALLTLDPDKLRRILPKAEPIQDSTTFPVFNYRNKDVKTLVWALKYKGNREILKLVAGFVYEEIIEIAQEKMLFEGKVEIILIPIPIGNEARKKRGFNQTEELCEVISKISGGEIKVANILEKSRETLHQTSLRRSERLNNMKNSIRLKEGKMQKWKDSLIIIIDDVYTTGATVREARRALGMRDALAITIAH